ncbi:unnamed protein product [Moneuplotes crassus]|uniref:Casein kinase I n=1 Tax=Euplotes crassus TaxID=5936 RepID=A0AAD1XPR3_EUPCR|nr:unnamed protein product [Moneuplotes crassus]
MESPRHESWPKVNKRYQIVRKLGQGTFSTVYEARDRIRAIDVALKVEKNRRRSRNGTGILNFEFKVMTALQCKTHVPRVFEYVVNEPDEDDYIAMELLGPNLTKVKKSFQRGFSQGYATRLLMQMLEGIQQVHEKGFIHRDIKASNFLLGDDNRVVLADFGLAKVHLNQRNGKPLTPRDQVDFRGTISFASLNAHYCKELSRRDDLWSWYFVLLDFYGETLKWRKERDNTMSQVQCIKEEALAEPEKYLWSSKTDEVPQIKEIFYHIKGLGYDDTPDYDLLFQILINILAHVEFKARHVAFDGFLRSFKATNNMPVTIHSGNSGPKNPQLNLETLGTTTGALENFAHSSSVGQFKVENIVEDNLDTAEYSCVPIDDSLARIQKFVIDQCFYPDVPQCNQFRITQNLHVSIRTEKIDAFEDEFFKIFYSLYQLKNAPRTHSLSISDGSEEDYEICEGLGELYYENNHKMNNKMLYPLPSDYPLTGISTVSNFDGSIQNSKMDPNLIPNPSKWVVPPLQIFQPENHPNASVNFPVIEIVENNSEGKKSVPDQESSSEEYKVEEDEIEELSDIIIEPNRKQTRNKKRRKQAAQRNSMCGAKRKRELKKIEKDIPYSPVTIKCDYSPKSRREVDPSRQVCPKRTRKTIIDLDD